MMNITVRFETQVKRAAGVSSKVIAAGHLETVAQVVRFLAEESGDQLRGILLNDAGEIRPTIVLFLDDDHVCAADECPLQDGAVLTIMSPISGG